LSIGIDIFSFTEQLIDQIVEVLEQVQQKERVFESRNEIVAVGFHIG